MSEPNPSLEEILFELALVKTSESERVAFLDGVCRHNPALRARLEVLLEGHFQAEGFLPGGPTPVELESKPVSKPDEGASTFIGRYKLLEKIGEGGFGEVWMAEQKEPVKRRVALKIIKLGMDTKQVVARFEAERQALALMDHPNIAKVLDAGATDTGRPYFVMELVRGVRITDYCDQNQLLTEERLKLFIQVCRAIQHAHQKGIIHRDIKPFNILVTLHDGVPVPKVIDFGIAKATQLELTEKTVFTQFHQFLGTPAYVSPEQAEMSGLDIDTRSDIYSLGVLLYELLTGTTPFDTQELLNAGLEGMRQIIRERKPLRPSTRLIRELTAKQADVSAQSKIKNQKSKISSDLDWIVMKCLEKDRGRRYETANGLAHDIERHLRDEPVVARPPSRLYEFQKTVRRHWVGFAAVAAVVAALAIGIAVSALEAVRARQAEREQSRLRISAQRAEQDQASQKSAAQSFLYKSLLGEAHATRLARRVGYRDKVFALLQQAKALDVPEKNVADLRQEAIASLGDFVGLTPAVLTNFSTNLDTVCLAPSGKLAAFDLADCAIELRELPSGRGVARFHLTNEVLWPCQCMCFNSTSDKLLATFGSRPGRLYCWALDPNGGWRETTNLPLPAVTRKLFSTAEGVFAINCAPIGITNGGIKVHGNKVEFLGLRQNERFEVRFRAFDAHTGSFAPGYAATNVMAAGELLASEASGDGQVLAVETMEYPDPAIGANQRREPNFPSLVNVYNWKTGERIGQLRRTSSGPLCLSDNAKYLVCLSEAHSTIYALPGFERITQFREPYYGLRPLVFGSRVALPEGSHLRLRNLARGDDVALLDEPGDPEAVGCSANGDTLLTKDVGLAHQARFYRLDTPEKLNLPSHAAAVPGAAFSPDGLRLASVGKDRIVRVCDALSGKVIWETNDLPDFGQSVSYSPDGRWLVVGMFDRDLVWIRDAHTGIRLLEIGDGRPAKPACVQFSPDGRYLATGGDLPVKIWEMEHGGTGETNETLQARLVASWGKGVALRFAPDSRSIAFTAPNESGHPPAAWSDSERPIYIWDFNRSAEPHRLASRIVGAIQCGGFAPERAQFIAVDAQGNILTLDVTGGRRPTSFHSQQLQEWIAALDESSVIQVQPSPDGSKLAVTVKTLSGESASLLDRKTGKLLYTLPGEIGNVYWLAWSPNSQRLAVCRANGNISIWSLAKVDQILAQLGLDP